MQDLVLQSLLIQDVVDSWLARGREGDKMTHGITVNLTCQRDWCTSVNISEICFLSSLVSKYPTLIFCFWWLFAFNANLMLKIHTEKLSRKICHGRKKGNDVCAFRQIAVSELHIGAISATTVIPTQHETLCLPLRILKGFVFPQFCICMYVW